MTASPFRLLLTAAVTAGLLLGTAACGKKGAPKPPEGQESQYTYPQPYPAPDTVTPDAEQDASEGTDPLSIFSDGKRSRTKTY